MFIWCFYLFARSNKDKKRRKKTINICCKIGAVCSSWTNFMLSISDCIYCVYNRYMEYRSLLFTHHWLHHYTIHNLSFKLKMCIQKFVHLVFLQSYRIRNMCLASTFQKYTKHSLSQGGINYTITVHSPNHIYILFFLEEVP